MANADQTVEEVAWPSLISQIDSAKHGGKLELGMAYEFFDGNGNPILFTDSDPRLCLVVPESEVIDAKGRPVVHGWLLSQKLRKKWPNALRIKLSRKPFAAELAEIPVAFKLALKRGEGKDLNIQSLPSWLTG